MQDAPAREYILEHFSEALEKGWIKPFFQPVVRSVSRRLCGMEALARWEDPEKGLLPPISFIPVLEDSRLIHRLDICIIRQVCALYRKNIENKLDIHIPVSVNLSRLDYELCDIFEEVEKSVEDYQVPRNILCIEITESVLNRNGEDMRQYIERFRRAGYQVWMDDFGSGYSSLNVLKDYQFDELKVDMRFLSTFHQKSRKILSSIIHMAKEIGIQTLAEGVETEEQFQFLRNIGCEKVQGYYFGKPLPFDECLGHVIEKGIRVEHPILRGYYDEMGKTDLLSAVPFMSAEERNAATTGRSQNSLPLALLEVQGDEVRLLFNNEAFDEATGEIDWFSIFGDVETDQEYKDAIRLSGVSVHLRRLLEETHSAGVGKMYFVDSDQYFMIQAKQVAASSGRWAVLIQLENLSRGAQISRQVHLDEGLRKIYGIYDQVIMMDFAKGTMTPLYDDSKEVRLPETGIWDSQKVYASEWIFPEDRVRFTRLMDPSTIERRIAQSRQGYISAHLRSRGYHGDYVWKIFIIVHIYTSVYFLLVRNSETEVIDFLHLTDRAEEDRVFSGERLWNNFIQNSPMKVFWKDENRRFKGASQSFLDFYGFPSLDSILGKTDEEMGWHLHPDNYESDEWEVIREGRTTHLVPGNCIVRGESRNIVASKMPLYDNAGKIRGLIGFFFLAAEAPRIASDNSYDNRKDPLTGLLNAQGLTEEVYSYRDEYDLRGVDFAWIEVSIEGFSDIVRLYGEAFGDNVIRMLGVRLLAVCGDHASIGRLTGCTFVVLHQFIDQKEIDEHVERIKTLSARLNQVEGTPFSLYVAVGMALFSETRNTDEQAKRAHLRMLTGDGRVSRHSQFREDMHRIFRLYDSLPIPCAVYQIEKLKEMNTSEAVILYVNPRLADRLRMDADLLVGRLMNDVFPREYEKWRDLAEKAAFEGAYSERTFYCDVVEEEISITVGPVVGAGYCLLTYKDE
ncbi:MAG: EAL domain-containing protein [Lachnospiraceae bacterium]|nr:EAL domain-containing protein [Lachnospiraceae bacterium]